MGQQLCIRGQIDIYFCFLNRGLGDRMAEAWRCSDRRKDNL